jgi:hypothetical protein
MLLGVGVSETGVCTEASDQGARDNTRLGDAGLRCLEDVSGFFKVLSREILVSGRMAAYQHVLYLA